MTGSQTKNPQVREAIMTFSRDVKFAFRSLARTKGLTITVILTLALGIGANAAIFGLVDGLWLHPMGVPQPGRIARIFSVTPQDAEASLSYPEYRAFAEQSAAFQGVVGWGGRGARIKAADGTHTLLLVNVVSNNFFQVLNIHPAGGRLFMIPTRNVNMASSFSATPSGSATSAATPM